jgi:imidazolonepropionase-like amidohydrolase
MLALLNCRLIDGTGHGPFDKISVLIEGNRIQSIQPSGGPIAAAGALDLQGLTLMPGLIDCHVHLGGLTIERPGKAMGKVSFRDMASFFLDYTRNYAHRRNLSLASGVTTIRSAGDHYPHIIRLRDKIATGKLSGPRIFTPGPTITAPGGHPAGTIYKGNRYIVENAVRQIADVQTAIEEVNRLAAGGVDCIKAIYSDLDPMNINHKVPKLPLKVLEALADTAHHLSLKLMVHTGSPRDTLDAVKAGADSIEHGILPGGDSTEFEDGLTEMMRKKGTFFVPTMAIAWSYKEAYPSFFSSLMNTVKKLSDAGVNLAAGTDCGTPGVVIGKGLHKELELMAQAGISPLAAIMSATKYAAMNLGRDKELGTIEPGKLADLIAVSGDPLKDIRDTQNIKLVVQDGKVLVNRRLAETEYKGLR